MDQDQGPPDNEVLDPAEADQPEEQDHDEDEDYVEVDREDNLDDDDLDDLDDLDDNEFMEGNFEERRLHAYLQVNPGNVHPDSDEDDQSAEDEEGESFDTALPMRHMYLGQGQEVCGRTIFEEDLIHELVIFPHPSIILMPGQTMPLTLLRPAHISAIEKLIATTKTFGSLYFRDV